MEWLFDVPAVVLMVIIVGITGWWLTRCRFWHELLLAAAALVVTGIALSTWGVYRARADARVSQLARVETFAAFEAAEIDKQMVLSGTLDGNSLLEDETLLPDDIGLVVYSATEFSGGELRTIAGAGVYPELNIVLDGGAITLVPVTRAAIALTEPTVRRDALVQRQTVSGFRDGDAVVVRGRKSDDNQLTAFRIHGGEMADLLEVDPTNARIVGIVGLVIGVFGCGVGFIAGDMARQRDRARAEQDAASRERERAREISRRQREARTGSDNGRD
ncbi:MAG: hypothetical protein AAFR56_13500 [Chloroflexota bacterium]